MSFPRESCEEVAFGPFRFDQTSGSLHRGNEEVVLQPRVLSLLSYLVANSGRVCSKNELLDNLWADSAVSQGSLSEAVKLLRQALGDDPRRPRYVQTVHRRGYRFIGATVNEAPADADASLQLPQPVLVGSVSVVVVVALLSIGAWVRNSPSDGANHFEIGAPPGTLMGPLPMDPYPALSPDGTKLALALRSTTVTELWVRDIRLGTVQRLAETAGAEYPFWSPSGDRLAYRIGSELWVADIAGGPPRAISPVTSRGGSWSSASGILVPSTEGLMQLAENGSPQGLATRLDASRNETAHQHPAFLPDGRTFLYVATAANPADSGTWIASTDSDRKKLLLEGPDAHNARYVAPGWLLSVRDGVLTAQRFDAQTWEFSGTPEVLSELMSLGSTARYSPFSANSDVLVFRESGRVNSELVWVEPDGTRGETLPAIDVPGMYMSPSLSPTGTRLAAGFHELDLNNQDVFVLDLPSGVWQQLTNTPNWDNAALWVADESAVVLTSARSGEPRPWIYRFKEAQPESVGRTGWVTSLMPNGDLVQWDSNGLSLVPLDGGEPRRVTPPGAHAVQGRVSPDGRWLAYTGGPTERTRVLVKALFDDSSPVPVSPKEGRQPRWGRDASELFYLEPRAGTATGGSIETTVTRVTVTASGTRLQSGPAESLFSFRHPIVAQNVSWNYEVDRTGDRFIINVVTSETPGRLRAIANWQDLLLRR